MALIECPNCGGQVSSFAKTCPHCGKELISEQVPAPAAPPVEPPVTPPADPPVVPPAAPDDPGTTEAPEASGSSNKVLAYALSAVAGAVVLVLIGIFAKSYLNRDLKWSGIEFAGMQDQAAAAMFSGNLHGLQSKLYCLDRNYSNMTATAKWNKDKGYFERVSVKNSEGKLVYERTAVSESGDLKVEINTYDEYSGSLVLTASGTVTSRYPATLSSSPRSMDLKDLFYAEGVQSYSDFTSSLYSGSTLEDYYKHVYYEDVHSEYYSNGNLRREAKYDVSGRLTEDETHYYNGYLNLHAYYNSQGEATSVTCGDENGFESCPFRNESFFNKRWLMFRTTLTYRSDPVYFIFRANKNDWTKGRFGVVASTTACRDQYYGYCSGNYTIRDGYLYLKNVKKDSYGSVSYTSFKIDGTPGNIELKGSFDGNSTTIRQTALNPADNQYKWFRGSISSKYSMY